MFARLERYSHLLTGIMALVLAVYLVTTLRGHWLNGKAFGLWQSFWFTLAVVVVLLVDGVRDVFQWWQSRNE